VKKVVVIGTGKVASHLIKAIVQAGHTIVQVVGRSEDSVQRLFATTGITLPYTCQKEQVCQEADLYICSVKDDAIAQAIAGINIPNHALLVHTSGSTDAAVLAPFATYFGVLYPMQTFSYGKEVDFTKIALYIEANNITKEDQLYLFASKLSPNIKRVNSAMRAKVHLAAVFACNFSNHLYTLAEKVLGEVNLPFSDLLPLIDETTQKVHVLSPREAQTGPAIRRDENIINKHLEQLDGKAKVIYELLTKSIQDDQF
jgi:predicted short-subunit dehydrogenase-like oxidoreductase (DUF2520 family)